MPRAVRTRLLLISVAVVAIAVGLGVRHDYKAYVLQWASVLSGGDRDPSDAYGPLHSLFAWAYDIAPLLPKAMFAGLAAACTALLMGRATWTERVHRTEATLLAVFLLNPLVFFSVYVYGQNDIVAAFLVLLSLVARGRDRPALAGLAIGLAALGKFYPLAIAGLLMLEGGRVLRLRVPVAAGATFVAGMALSYVTWGRSTFAPLLFASDRDAKMLSPYRFLTCHPELVGGQDAVAMLLNTNTLVVVGVGLCLVVLLHSIAAEWKSAAALGLLAVLATYKVGHPQFYVTWLVCFAWLIVEASSAEDRSLVKALAPTAIFLAAFEIVYALSGAMTGDWAYLRCYASLPFIAVVGGSIFLGLVAVWKPLSLRGRIVW